MILQQGDILLKRVDNIPSGLIPRKSGEITVGHGEVTGHTHTIEQATWLATAVDDINHLHDFAANGGDPIYVLFEFNARS